MLGYGQHGVRHDIDEPEALDPSNPPIGQLHYYLVTAENGNGESPLGFTSPQMLEEPNSTPCP